MSRKFYVWHGDYRAMCVREKILGQHYDEIIGEVLANRDNPEFADSLTMKRFRAIQAELEQIMLDKGD